LCVFLFPSIWEQEQKARIAELRARSTAKVSSYQVKFSMPNDKGEIIIEFQRLTIREEQFLASSHSYMTKKRNISLQKV